MKKEEPAFREENDTIEFIDLPGDNDRSQLKSYSQVVGGLSPFTLRGAGICLLALLSFALVFMTITPSNTIWNGLISSHTPTPVSTFPVTQAPVRTNHPQPAETVRIMRGGYGDLTIVPGFIPEECPLGAVVSGTGEVGAFPLWITGFNGPNAFVSLYQVRVSSIKKWHGWKFPLQLRMKYAFSEPVTLTVGILGSGPPAPVFSRTDSTTSTSTVTLKAGVPADPTSQARSEQAGIWETNLSIFGSGCYALTVSWPTGHWQIMFAAGE